MRSLSPLRRWLLGFRDSLFWLPMLAITVALVAAWGTARIDAAAATSGVWWLVALTIDGRRALLSALATSSAAVLGLGTSALVITVQLASSQYSPRVVRTFIRERVVRAAIAAMLALFAFSITTLALPPEARGGADGGGGGGGGAQPGTAGAPQEDVAATVALAGGLVALVLLVAMVDRIARSMEAGSVIRRVLTEFHDALDHVAAGHAMLEPSRDDEVDGRQTAVVAASQDAWLVGVDRRRLLEALPPGSTVALDVAVGRFCIAGYPVLRVWTDEEVDDQRRHELLSALQFGMSRDGRSDVAFGLRKFNDVILRALSPAVNDPGTAYEAMASMAAAVAALLQVDLPPPVHRDDHGRRLVEPFTRDHREYVHLAYEQVRQVAADHPAMAVAMLGSLRRVRTVLEHAGSTEHLDLFDTQRDALLELVAHRDHAPTDLRRIHEAARLATESDRPGAADAEPDDAREAS